MQIKVQHVFRRVDSRPRPCLTLNLTSNVLRNDVMRLELSPVLTGRLLGIVSSQLGFPLQTYRIFTVHSGNCGLLRDRINKQVVL